MALTNRELKHYVSLKQKKFREAENKFLIEGFHLVEECLNSSFQIEGILIREDTRLGKNTAISTKVSELGIPVHTINNSNFSKISDTENSQGIAAVVRKPNENQHSEEQAITIALDKINDPGNFGTILRTAYWFGIRNVIASVGSAEVYNSKVLRSSQGAVFHVNVRENLNMPEELSRLKSEGHEIFLFTPRADEVLEGRYFGGKSVFVFGNESYGISDEILEKDFPRLKISGYSGCESLNVAISCSIALYHYRSVVK